jgi:hypothetical protein
MGKKKVKNTKLTLNVWVCCNCKKKDVAIVEYNKKDSSKSTSDDLDTEGAPLIE